MVRRFSGPIEQDPAIVNLLNNMPASIQKSFSEIQLIHLRNAVASRQWGNHKIDVRGTFPLFKFRYYYVILAGKNQRTLSRAELVRSRLINALLLSTLLTLSLTLGLLVLYLFKSALGINLFAGFSLGIWDWFKTL
jgi:hypothetical protein